METRVAALSPNPTIDDPSVAAIPEGPVTRISATAPAPLFPATDVWRFRGLLYFLTLRNIQLRYKQTAFGFAWAVFQPLLIALSLSMFLGKLVTLPSGSVSYLAFVYAAMVPWQLFAQVVNEVSQSLNANASLITKVYFPRLLLPLSSVGAGLMDALIRLVVLLPILAHYHIRPTVAILAAPLFMLLAVLCALGAGLTLAALNARYRDVNQALGIVLQFLFFASPVAFPSTVVSSRWTFWYGLNPLVGSIEGFRWSVLGTGSAPVVPLLAAAIITAVLLVTGLYYFHRAEKSFADVI